MTAATITRDDVLRAVCNVIAADPERSNGGICTYVISEKPHCIAGVTLAALGVDIETLKAMDSHGSVFTSGTTAILREAGVDVEALELLDTLQERADGRYGAFEDDDGDDDPATAPWSVALAYAEEKLGIGQ